MSRSSLVLGGGCFWCLEAAYTQLRGVTRVNTGYSGGQTTSPIYEEVLTGRTGHVEVVRVEWDEGRVSLETILAVFWSIHDPTSLNSQGADVGTQYASVIFYVDKRQRGAINASKLEAESQLGEPVVTRVEPLDEFYEAEAYHQKYYQNNQDAGYCQIVIEPKLVKLRQHFAPLLSDQPMI